MTAVSQTAEKVTGTFCLTNPKRERGKNLAASLALRVSVALACGATWAADTSADEFRAYPLRFVQAAEIEVALSGILPAGSEVVADGRGNRILVRGTPQSHHAAQSTIQSLDQPRRSKPAAATAKSLGEPVMRAYRCMGGNAEATATWLRDQFGSAEGMKVVADPRTSQILVLATPDTQSKVAATLKTAGKPNPSPAQRAGSPSGPAPSLRTTRSPSGQSAWSPNSSLRRPTTPESGAFRSQTVQLWHTTGGRFESALTAMLGKRISRSSAVHADVSLLTLAVSGRRKLALSIDRRAGRVKVEGTASAVESCIRLVHALDNPDKSSGMTTKVVPLQSGGAAHLDRAVRAIQTGNTSRPARVAMLAQQPKVESAKPEAATRPAAKMPAPSGQPLTPEATRPPSAKPENPGAAVAEDQRSLVGPVQVELLDGLDIIVIRGTGPDVDQVIAVIEQIERLAAITEPAIEVFFLRHVDCEALGAMVNELYGQIYALRQGTVSVTALVKPNALLLIGQRGNVDTALDLIERLDRPVAPETQFRVFRLKHASAETVGTQIQEFYTERVGLGVKVVVTSDYRSNSLVIMARPRDMAEVEALIGRLDTPTSDAVHEIRVIKLQNSLADDLAPILQEAISGDGGTMRQAGARPGAQRTQTGRAQGTESKAAMLSLLAVDAQGRRRLRSGILTDARITSDPRANALVVSAPAQSMPLLEALIHQLDQLPAAEAQLKVFTIINGDATSMVEMLETLFAEQAGADAIPVQTAAAEGDSSLVPLRFAVDVRSNSIIASGTTGDLTVVEAILLRLDESDVRNRKSLVYRLRNAPAMDVANAINEFLRSERQVQQSSPGLMSAFEQIEREVVVVPEVVSNSLIISATPRFYDEIVKLIEDIDERPPMVMIQVLIAEVALNDTDEFGVELGLQDSILFDRSILDNIQTLNTTTVDASGASTETQDVVSADITPGFAFNNQPLGNGGSALENSVKLGSQALSTFGVNRINSELGYGGLVLSASSESVSILIRALQDRRRLDVLSRPQVMTLDNQPAFIQVGQEVPTIRGTTLNETGQLNNIEYANVGLILGVTPRISPDGLVVMEIDAVKSEVGPEEEGIPISISATGDIVRSPRINTTRAQTTVAALDGQTIVMGGLITKSKSTIHRRVPLLASIPVVGNLFRYDNVSSQRTELLIIMTPHIVDSEEDADEIKQVEAARMSWCLGDVMEMHGEVGLRSRCDNWEDGETMVIYPDLNLGAETIPSAPGVPLPPSEAIPAPEGPPAVPERIPGLPPGSVPGGIPDAGGPQPMPQGGASASPYLPNPEKAKKPAFRPFHRLRQQFAEKKAETPPAGFRQPRSAPAPQTTVWHGEVPRGGAPLNRTPDTGQPYAVSRLPDRASAPRYPDWPSQSRPAEPNPLRDSTSP